MSQVSLQVKGHESQVILEPGCAEIRDVLDDGFRRVEGDSPAVRIKSGGQETQEGESGQNAQGERENGVRPRKDGVHGRFLTKNQPASSKND